MRARLPFLAVGTALIATVATGGARSRAHDRAAALDADALFLVCPYGTAIVLDGQDARVTTSFIGERFATDGGRNVFDALPDRELAAWPRSHIVTRAMQVTPRGELRYAGHAVHFDPGVRALWVDLAVRVGRSVMALGATSLTDWSRQPPEHANAEELIWFDVDTWNAHAQFLETFPSAPADTCFVPVRRRRR